MQPGPHKVFIHPARKQADLWRIPFALIVAWGGGLILSWAAWPVLSAVLRPAALDQLVDISGVGRPTPLASLFTLGSFGFFIVAMRLALNLLHQRSVWTLLGDRFIAFEDFWRVAKAVLLLQAVLSLLPSSGPDLIQNHAVAAWLILLPITLFCLLLQVTAEELIFRGYLQQQLAVKFASKWVWMVVPSVLFGLMHYFPEQQGANAPFIALWAICFGLVTADLTARTGTLGAAIGLHFANNLLSIVFVSMPGPVAGVALFIYPQMALPDTLDPALFVQLLVLWMSWMAARIAIRA